MRYIFLRGGQLPSKKLEWHIFDIIFLFGLSYALKHKKHVRVDIFFVHFKKETKAIIEILSIPFLLIPFGLFLVVGLLFGDDQLQRLF